MITKILIVTKVRIYPTQEQAEFSIAQFGAVRFAYNNTLYLKSYMYRKHGVTLNKKGHKITACRCQEKYHCLKQYDSIALQQSVINLYQAFDNFFNPKLKAKCPQFKRRHGKQSSYHCVEVKVLDGAIKLLKLKPIEANIHRAIAGIVKSITSEHE